MTSPARGPTRWKLRPLLLALAVSGVGPALAQTTAPETPPGSGQGAVPEATQPLAPSPESLSDQLSDTQGVITPPPGVDPEIVQPPPDDGTAAGRIIRPPPPVTTE